MNFLDGIDPQKLQSAISLIQNSIGKAESKKLENAVADENTLNQMLSSLGEKEKQTIKKVLSDPQLLSMILSSPKAKEGIKNFINEV